MATTLISTCPNRLGRTSYNARNVNCKSPTVLDRPPRHVFMQRVGVVPQYQNTQKYWKSRDDRQFHPCVCQFESLRSSQFNINADDRLAVVDKADWMSFTGRTSAQMNCEVGSERRQFFTITLHFSYHNTASQNTSPLCAHSKST